MGVERVVLGRETSYEEICQKVKEAAEGETSNVLLIVVPDSIDGYVDVKEII